MKNINAQNAKIDIMLMEIDVMNAIGLKEIV